MNAATASTRCRRDAVDAAMASSSQVAPTQVPTAVRELKDTTHPRAYDHRNNLVDNRPSTGSVPTVKNVNYSGRLSCNKCQRPVTAACRLVTPKGEIAQRDQDDVGLLERQVTEQAPVMIERGPPAPAFLSDEALALGWRKTRRRSKARWTSPRAPRAPRA